jgi:hypothetical protein
MMKQMEISLERASIQVGGSSAHISREEIKQVLAREPNIQRDVVSVFRLYPSDS